MIGSFKILKFWIWYMNINNIGKKSHIIGRVKPEKAFAKARSGSISISYRNRVM